MLSLFPALISPLLFSLQEALPPVAPAPPPPVVRLFRGATVHSGVAGSAPAKVDVLVEGDRILKVGLDLEIPSGAERVDCTGQHLIPGLIDGLANHDPEHDLLYIASGVTLLRDPGNERARILQERERLQRDRVPGPDLFIAGMILDGSPPATNHSAVMRDEVAAAQLLPRILEDAPNFLSVARGLPAGALRRAIHAAHAAKLEVWGFLPVALEMEDALKAGIDGFFGVDAFLFAERAETSAERLGERIQAAGKAGLKLTPLLNAAAITLADWTSEPEVLDSLAPHYLPLWRGRLQEILAQSHEVRAKSQALYQEAKELCQKLERAGVRLVPGSGAPHPLLAPGSGLIDELELWVELGFSPGQVLHWATGGAAEALGVAEERGSIAAGKLADLVLLAADPALNIGALRQVAGVLVRGQWLGREDLDEKLRELRARQTAALIALSDPLEVALPQLPEGALVLEARYETRALGLRTSAEHLAVVREPDGATTFATRIVTPESTAGARTEVELSQRYRDRALESFELSIRGGERELNVKGLAIGELLQVERRVNGFFMDNQRARKRLLLVDVGSALTEIVLGQYGSEGSQFALYFEGIDPVESEWRMEFADDDKRLLVATGQGPLICGLAPEGAPFFSFRRAGNAATELVRLDVHTFGGPGLALEPSRIFVHPEQNPKGESDK